jgi:hypothetical protein
MTALSSQPGLTIAETAERTGLTAHTRRYYERDGLMLAVDRSASGHRRYTERLDLLRAHRERVQADLDAVTQHLRAIDHKISIYEKAEAS